jgi:mRNA-degrading endonuclease RelE of RelBE toxin-antitoxin system
LRRGHAYAKIYALYEIRFAVSVVRDLRRLRANQRRRIIDEIRGKLAEEPTKPTKHIKQLRKLVPPFEAVPPIWQLRIGDHRVFYDVDDQDKKVFVRAIRRTSSPLTTEQIL